MKMMTKVMLIEDDQTMLDLLGVLLEMEGFQVVKFNGGGDVFAIMKEENPSVILLDVNLKDRAGKEIDGFDILRAIRRDDKLMEIKVVMSSGYDYTEKSESEGADEFILKPFMPDDLILRIKNLIT